MLALDFPSAHIALHVSVVYSYSREIIYNRTIYRHRHPDEDGFHCESGSSQGFSLMSSQSFLSRLSKPLAYPLGIR